MVVDPGRSGRSHPRRLLSIALDASGTFPATAPPGRTGLPANQCGAPGQATADGFHQHQVSRLDAAVAYRSVQRQRDRGGRIQPGHLVLMEAVGGGLTWGAALVRW